MRTGRKGHGKIRHFWNEGRVFLGREACLARGPVNAIEEVGCRVADRVVIYVGFALSVFGFATPVGDWRLQAAVARKRRDLARGETVKRDTFGTGFAPFSGERRAALENLSTLSRKWAAGSRIARKFTLF